MSDKGYTCDACSTVLPSDRARVHCRICPDYDLCADCHVTESVSGTHSVEHDYEVYIRDMDRPVLVKAKSIVTSRSLDSNSKVLEATKTSEEPPPATLGVPSAPPASGASARESASASAGTCLDVAASEAYWGQLLAPTKTPSPIFSRLITAVFAHFDAASAGVLQPGEFCALMFASGYTVEQFPPLKVSTNDSASPADLHDMDAWLANWIQSFPLDHRMATREFPPPPPIEPVNGRIRMRDQLLHALMYPEAPIVPNGQPLLSRLGLEQYFLHLLLHDPGSLSGRVNHLLGALPRLSDPETSLPFEMQLIPRSCFPLLADPEAEEKKRMLERHQMDEEQRLREARLQAEHHSNMMIMQAMRNAAGGWRIDRDGNRSYEEGYF